MSPKHPLPRRWRGRGVAAATAVAVAVWGAPWNPTPPAYADAASCAKWHASGQREARAGHLKRAAELFTWCGSNQSCPAPIRTDCVELYGNVDKSTPTVIFLVRDARGNDLTNVRVYAGERLLAERLDGRAVAVDPGRYQFRFVLPSGESLSSEILVREAEKNRTVSAKVPPGTPSSPPAVASTAGPAQGAASAVSRASSPSSPGSMPVGFWVSSALSAAALASWGAFALLGRSQQSQLDECSPNCPASRRDNYEVMRRDYLIADVSIAVAAVSAGVAVWWFLSNGNASPPPEEHTANRPRIRVSVMPSPAGAGASITVGANAL